jgi:hypothetical protein
MVLVRIVVLHTLVQRFWGSIRNIIHTVALYLNERDLHLSHRGSLMSAKSGGLNQPMEPHMLILSSDQEGVYSTSTLSRGVSDQGNSVSIYPTPQGFETVKRHPPSDHGALTHSLLPTRKHVGDTTEYDTSVYVCNPFRDIRDMHRQTDEARGRGVSWVQLDDVVGFLNKRLAHDKGGLSSPIYVEEGCNEL